MPEHDHASGPPYLALEDAAAALIRVALTADDPEPALAALRSIASPQVTALVARVLLERETRLRLVAADLLTERPPEGGDPVYCRCGAHVIGEPCYSPERMQP